MHVKIDFNASFKGDIHIFLVVSRENGMIN